MIGKRDEVKALQVEQEIYLEALATSYTVTKLDQATGAWDYQNGGTYTVHYLVASSDSTPVTPIVARQAVYQFTGINPSVGATYSNGDEWDTSAWLTTVDASQTGPKGDRHRFVTLSYNYVPVGEINPLLQPPRINFSVSPVGEQPVYRDIHGNPILNRAGMPPADPVMKPVYRATMSISKYFSFVPTVFSFAVDCVNGDYFYGFAPGQCLCMDYSSSDQGISAQWGQIYDVTVNFHISPDGWIKYVLNSGTMVLGDSGKAEHALDGNSEHVSEPVLLGWDGKKLPTGQPPIFMPFQINNMIPFGGFFG